MSTPPIELDPSRPPSRDGWARRRVVQGLALMAGTIPSAMGGCQSMASAASVPNFRRPGDRDDTAAVVRAQEAGAMVHFPAGRGSAPDGAYLLRAVPLRSGVTVRGEGERSVLRAQPGAMAALTAVSKTAAEPLQDITMRDLRIEGLVADTGFREHFNLVSVSGVHGLRIDRVQFVGFPGDGLYLGAEYGWPEREPRIIRDVIVSDCLFDGVTGDNRNGISVTGGSDITIDRCRFRRCTRPNMPGPIDFEPDAFPFYELKRLRVTNCDFEDCGGNVGQVALVVPAMVPLPRSVLIAGNSFRKYRGTGGDIAITVNREPQPAMPGMDCLIERNVGRGGYGGVQIFSGKGVVIRDNRWTGYSGRSFLGFDQPTAGVMDVTISDRFEGCGWRDGVALAVYKGDGIRLDGNRFTGTGHRGPGSAPLYLGTGRIRRLALVRNDFRDNPAALGLMIVERGADYLAGTTEMLGNLTPEGRALPAL